MTQKYQVKVSMKQAAIVETGIVLKQGDFGMQLEIEVLDFDATGTTPQIVFRKAMGAVESTTITVSSNKYTYTFKGTELDTPGKVFCDLKLKNSTTQRISTASFMFKVVADTLDGLTEESSSYSDTIEQLLGDVVHLSDTPGLVKNDGTINNTIEGEVTKQGQQIENLLKAADFTDESWVTALETGSAVFKPSTFTGGAVNLLTGAVEFITPPTSSIIDKKATLIKLYGDAIRLKIKTGMRVRMVLYNPDGTYNNWANWITTSDGYPSLLQNKKGYYVRIFGSYTDGRSLSQADFDALSEFYSLESENISKYVDDSIAVYGGIKAIDNILNPADFLVRGYYLNTDDGYTHVPISTDQRISSNIYTGPISGVCLRQQYDNDSTSTIIIYCYNDAGEYLGYSYIRFNAIKGNSFALEVKRGTTNIVVYSGAVNSGASHLCVSLYELAAFTYYSSKPAIKTEVLPDGKLTKKTIVNFGDSIFGNHRPASDISTQIALKTNAIVHNLGFGGCKMSATNDDWNAFSMQALAESIAANDYSVQDAVDIGSVSGMPQYFINTRALLESIDFSKVDIVTISYGTNDFTAGATLDDDNNPLNRNTICGALRYSIETLLAAYPNLRIFVLTPTYRFWLNGTTFVEDSNTKVINGIKLTDIVNKYIDIAKSYNLPVIDDYYSLGINKYNRGYYFPSNDGTHQNNNGVILIAEHIINELF